MDQYDQEIARVISKDSLQRELVRKYGPTPQEEREQREQLRRMAINAEFELGDHLPDGTVMFRTELSWIDPQGLRRWVNEIAWPAIKPHE